MKKKIWSLCFCLGLFANSGFTQDIGSSPELLQLTKSAGDFLAKGDYDNAAAMYTQAIRMAPDNVALRRDLAYTYFLKKDFQKSREIITPVVNSTAADEQTFQIASAVENALGNTSKARRIINSGLDRFPNSGILYNAKGNLLVNPDPKKNNSALKEWNNGIMADPGYAMNYYNTAKTYFQRGEMMWSILYGESFVNLEPYSARTAEMKKLVYDAYQKVFTPSDDTKIPEFTGSENAKSEAKSFSAAYHNSLNANISTVSDGFNVENLAMLRTRFIINWNKNYAHRFPFSLFDYHTKLIKSGHFPAYNQWLFGATESSQSFGIWVNQNIEQYKKFELWMKNNPYRPNSSDQRP